MGNWFSNLWNSNRIDSSSSSSNVPFTVFISHAGEDKATIAIPLREKLQDKGITAFVDADMSVGTEAQLAMRRGMETAEICVIVLSPEFVVREWPMKELLCFLKRREDYLSEGNGDVSIPKIVPFFYRLSIEELYEEPKLDRRDRNGVLLHEKRNSRFLERQRNGEPEADVNTIRTALRSLHGMVGVENTIGADNDSSYDMYNRRNVLLDELCAKICVTESNIVRLETSRDNGQGRVTDSNRAERARFDATERRSANESEGEGDAIYNLALRHDIGGGGVEQNAVEAERLYRQAMGVGNTRAMSRLARMLMIGANGVPRNTVQAAELYRCAARKGDVDAMCELAAMLECGADGVQKDPEEAGNLYRRAIELRNDDAMCSLAMMLEKGAEGVAANPREAEELYRQAIAFGNVHAMYNLARMRTNGAEGVERNLQEAEELFRRAIGNGHVNAMFSLALMLDSQGSLILEPDALQAQSLYRRASHAGHVGAMYNLAVMLRYGAEGVKRNVVEAETFYRLAIDSGDERAMYDLARMLETGEEDGEQHSVEAANLYRRAIQSRHVGAMFNLARMLTFGAEGVKRNAVEAERLYRLACDGGHTGAMRSLAVMLTNGAEGVRQNLKEAEELLERYRHDESHDIEPHDIEPHEGEVLSTAM